MTPLLAKIIGIEILKDSPLFDEIHQEKAGNDPLLAALNNSYHDEKETLALCEKIIGRTIDASTTISLPFYTDFGKHIFLGKDIFINKNVMFVDLGGIYLDDRVLIGPNARLITVNHLMEPEKRRGILVKPIHVKENAWIGANATILPGVTIGKNAVVAADATVTKDVADNVIVAGSPAKVIKKIE
ncbi:DapH/DapD/GlmU-related protein [Enterococcus sp. UD-01]|jgi:acetyltransferase-like isoleucine patch superfamily enzyme|uniref:DapH/DapD/GlmU-related protein n=1 Tax=Enterococcus sp. UD-01 TaxID=3373911 RepID=UPI003832842A